MDPSVSSICFWECMQDFVLLFLQFNTVTENLDLGDNYLEGDGAAYLCRMLKDNMFIVSLVRGIIPDLLLLGL